MREIFIELLYSVRVKLPGESVSVLCSLCIRLGFENGMPCYHAMLSCLAYDPLVLCLVNIFNLLLQVYYLSVLYVYFKRTLSSLNVLRGLYENN